MVFGRVGARGAVKADQTEQAQTA
ncbi:MAG: hypothetical protein QOD90_2558, partial [Mycobacterium sp.]|nr:hypothetical protein [Mycobacterium sp.]